LGPLINERGKKSDMMVGVFTSVQVTAKVIGTANKIDVIANGTAKANINKR